MADRVPSDVDAENQVPERLSIGNRLLRVTLVVALAGLMTGC